VFLYYITAIVNASKIDGHFNYVIWLSFFLSEYYLQAVSPMPGKTCRHHLAAASSGSRKSASDALELGAVGL